MRFSFPLLGFTLILMLAMPPRNFASPKSAHRRRRHDYDELISDDETDYEMIEQQPPPDVFSEEERNVVWQNPEHPERRQGRYIDDDQTEFVRTETSDQVYKKLRTYICPISRMFVGDIPQDMSTMTDEAHFLHRTCSSLHHIILRCCRLLAKDYGAGALPRQIECYSCMSLSYQTSWKYLQTTYIYPKVFTDRCRDPSSERGMPTVMCSSVCVSLMEPDIEAGVFIGFKHIRGCLDRILRHGFNQSALRTHRFHQNNQCRTLSRSALFNPARATDPPAIGDVQLCSCMDDAYINQPSTSNCLEQEQKNDTVIEYIDDQGNSVIFDASTSTVFVDADGNTVICTESFDDYAQNVVQEEIVGMNSNNDMPNEVLLTANSLKSKPVLECKSGVSSKKDLSVNRTINKDGSLLNKNLPDMKNMFNVISQSAMRKVENVFNSNVDTTTESASETKDIYNSFLDGEGEKELDMNNMEMDLTVTQEPMEKYRPLGSRIYHEDWPLYCRESIDFKSACEILTGARFIPEELICKTFPQNFQQEGTFIIYGESNHLPVTSDNLGKWGSPCGKIRFYKKSDDGKVIRVDDGKGNLKEWAKDFTYRVSLKKYEHVLTKKSRENGKGFYEKKEHPWDFTHLVTQNKFNHSKLMESNNMESENPNREITRIPKTACAFFEGFPLYSTSPLEFTEAAMILIGGTTIDANKKCEAVPVGYRENGTFVIDLKRLSFNILEIRRDANGQWSKPSGQNRYYKFDTNGDAIRVDRSGKLMKGIEYDIKVLCKRYDNLDADKKFVRKIYTASTRAGLMFEGSPNVAVLSYMWKSEPIPFVATGAQNNVIANSKDCKMIIDEDEFIDPDLDEECVQVVKLNEPSRSRRRLKRPRFESGESETRILVNDDSNQVDGSLLELRHTLIKNEFENQARLAGILDRAEHLLNSIEQRFVEPEIDIYQPNRHQDDLNNSWTEPIIEEEVVSCTADNFQ
ncbi:unnamed protein product [Caenorhabditis bovis]|uniref:Uncharacterized protein n=1 Tax=Caenorhabditis bovis TaxID=2654633 RepID=A0A8S1E9H3_9PELO|nr:unnamed protein product [Caenorhabditis bovis]